GDGEDVVVAADGGVGVAEDLAEAGVAEQAADDVLDAVVDGLEPLADEGQLAAGAVEDVAAAVDAGGDGFRDGAEVLGWGEQLDQALVPVGQPHAVAVHVAGAGEGVGHLEELLDGQLRADGGAADDEADVVQACEGRREARGQGIDHLADQGQLVARVLGVAERGELAGELLAQRAGGVAGDELADLVELQQIERVAVHWSRTPALHPAPRTRGRRGGLASSGRRGHCKAAASGVPRRWGYLSLGLGAVSWNWSKVTLSFRFEVLLAMRPTLSFAGNCAP